MVSETEIIIPGFTADALGIKDWISGALGLAVGTYSRKEDGVIRFIGDLSDAQKTSIGTLLQKHADLLLTSDVMAFAADNIATATVTVTVSDKANENFDVLVYEELAGVGTAITETVSLNGAGVGAFGLGPTPEPGVYVVELISADYFARVSVGAI
jgi:hypothetical protein